MGTVAISIPMRLRRQYAKPIDVDMEFDTTADRTAFLTVGRRYAGMRVFDKEDKKLYYLNWDRASWKRIWTESDFDYTQFIVRTGDQMSGNLLFSGGNGIDSTLSGGTDVLNVGTSNADTINIGWSGATINIQGTLLYQNVTNLEVRDKLIRLNKGGSASSGVSSGFEIEEGGTVTGYFATDATRTGWDFKSPASQVLTFGLDLLTAARVIKAPDAAGTIVLNDNTATLTNKSLSGSANTFTNIGNSSLVNSSVTIGSTNIALGATALILAGLTSVTASGNIIAGDLKAAGQSGNSGSIQLLEVGSLFGLQDNYLAMYPSTSTQLVFAKKVSGVTTSWVFNYANIPSGSARAYYLPSVNGTLLVDSDLNAYVPYTGATTNVNVGTHSITANLFIGSGASLTSIPNGALVNSTISGVALGGSLFALTATNSSLTFSGSYDGSSARTVGINEAFAHTWTANQTFASAGAPIYINSTNSNGNKLVFQAAGTQQGSLGTDGTHIMMFGDASGTVQASIGLTGSFLTNGNISGQAISGTTGTFSSTLSVTGTSTFNDNVTITSVKKLYFPNSGATINPYIVNGAGNIINIVNDGGTAMLSVNNNTGVTTTIPLIVRGTNPGGIGASALVVDFNAGNARLFSYGTNTSTNGGFVFNSQRSDGSNGIDLLTLTSSGASVIGTLGVTGATSLSSTLNVSGVSTLANNVQIRQSGASPTLTMYNVNDANVAFISTGGGGLASYLYYGLLVGNNTAITAGYTFEVVGSSKFSSTVAMLAGATVATSLTVGTTLGVTGAATFSSTVGIAGATTISNSLTITKATSDNNLILDTTSGQYTSLYFKNAATTKASIYWDNTGSKFYMSDQGTGNGLYVSSLGVNVVGALAVSSTITGSSFTGAGTGLTGTASALSIGGNAATATLAANSTLFNNFAISSSFLAPNSVNDYVMVYDGTNSLIKRATFANFVTTLGGNWLPLSGGTLTGALVGTNITANNIAATAYTGSTVTLTGALAATTGTFSGAVIPSATTTYNLGSTSNKWLQGYIVNMNVGTGTYGSWELGSDAASNGFYIYNDTATNYALKVDKTTNFVTIQTGLISSGRIVGNNLQVGPNGNLNDVSGVSGTLQFGNGAIAFVTASADAYMYKSQSAIGSLPVGTLVSQIRSDVTGGSWAWVAGSTPAVIMTLSNAGFLSTTGGVSSTSATFTSSLVVNSGTTSALSITSAGANYVTLNDKDAFRRIWFETVGSYRTIFDIPTSGSLVVRDHSGTILETLTEAGLKTFAGNVTVSGGTVTADSYRNSGGEFIVGYNGGAMRLGSGSSLPVTIYSGGALAATFNTSQVATFTSSVFATNFTTKGSESNTAGLGPYYQWGNTGGTRYWLAQLNTSENIDFHYFNGTSWAVKQTLGSDGSIVAGGTITASGSISGTGTLNAFGVANTSQSNIKTAAGYSGVRLQSLYNGGVNYQGGIVWDSSDQSAGTPKAAIYAQMTSSGAYLHFGTSNNYGAGVGVTNDMIYDYTGNLSVPGSVTSGSGMSAVGSYNLKNNSGTTVGWFGSSDNLITSGSSSNAALRAETQLDFSIGSTRYMYLTSTGLNMTVANNPGVSIMSGASGSYAYFQIGRTAPEFYLGVAAVAGNFATASHVGDTVLNTNGSQLILSQNSVSVITLNTANQVIIGTTAQDTSGTPTPAVLHVQWDTSSTVGTNLASMFRSNYTGSGSGKSGQGLEQYMKMSGGDKGSMYGIISNMEWSGTTGTLGASYAFDGRTACSSTGTTTITEAVTFRSSGIVNINGTATGITVTNMYHFYAKAVSTTGITYTNGAYSFYAENGAGSLHIGELGTGTVYTNGGTFTNTNPSDIGLKNTIFDITYGLNEILLLKPKSFYYNDDTFFKRKKWGLIAQDVQPIMPDLVHILPNNPRNPGKYFGLDSEALVPILIKALQELNAKFEEYKESHA